MKDIKVTVNKDVIDSELDNYLKSELAERQLLENFRACSEADRDRLTDQAQYYAARETEEKTKRSNIHIIRKWLK